MNDKLKQLAEDAGYCYAPVDEGYENRDSYNSFDYKEFALLILKEVFNACDVCEPQANPEYVLCEMFGIDHNWRLLDE